MLACTIFDGYRLVSVSECIVLIFDSKPTEDVFHAQANYEKLFIQTKLASKQRRRR